jgi:hypothetical protein
MPLSKKELMALIYPEFSGPGGEELLELYRQLSYHAGHWRGTQPTDTTDAPLHEEIVEQYRKTFQELVDLGWDWHNIDVENMLPDALMPDVYYNTLSKEQLRDTLLTQVRWWHDKTARPTITIFSFDKAYRRLLHLGTDPETILPRQNAKESSPIWHGIPLSPEGFYERNPTYRDKKNIR